MFMLRLLLILALLIPIVYAGPGIDPDGLRVRADEGSGLDPHGLRTRSDDGNGLDPHGKP